MSHSIPFSEPAYSVEDGDVGYAGITHASFVPFRPPCVVHIRATMVGTAALDRIYRMLRDRRAGRGR